MYIQKILIENIRSISHFEMEFPKPAGWHVLIGDNGSGKTTVLRAIAAPLIIEVNRANPIMTEWLKIAEEQAIAKLIYDDSYWIELGIKYSSNRGFNVIMCDKEENSEQNMPIKVFSAGYGSLRIAQENEIIDDITPQKKPQILAHKTLLGGKNALMSAEYWLKELQYAVLEGGNDQKTAQKLLDLIISLINDSNLLPYNRKIGKIGRAGISFQNEKGIYLAFRHLSDGFRSILNIVLDFIFRMVGFYGEAEVLRAFDNEQKVCMLEGVVLIDEIDAHLHPTWQTRIGQWFTQYFPNIQFIVTTHSPLVCRACDKGSIWRLAAPDSDVPSGEITGIERERLIYGNILDAYGTEIFGDSASINVEAAQQRNRLGELYEKSIMGLIKSEEETEFTHLKGIFPTFQHIGILAK